MALIKSINGLTPKWGKDCYFSENATIVGEVTKAVDGNVIPVCDGGVHEVEVVMG